MKKRYFETSCIIIFVIVMAICASRNQMVYSNLELSEKVDSSVLKEYEEALLHGADLCFWYDDASYETYLKEAAAVYYEKENILVELVYSDAFDYVGGIYEKTMENGAFPDAYLLSGEELEKAYFYGVAGINEKEEAYEGVVAENAVAASSYKEKMYGYPLSYNVCLFAYHNQFFETAPESLQAIIDYSDDNEPEENVSYLLEWDVYDPFFGFPFVSESVEIQKNETGVMEVVYDEEMLHTSMTFLKESLESFSVPIETVSEQSVIEDVLGGVTLCAIVDSDSLCQLSGADAYEIMEFPRLNDTLDAKSAALTDMVLVNDFSKKKEKASDFATYLTLEKSKDLWRTTGHYSVLLRSDADAREQIAYQAYENAILAPNAYDAGGFWVNLKEMITQYF